MSILIRIDKELFKWVKETIMRRNKLPEEIAKNNRLVLELALYQLKSNITGEVFDIRWSGKDNSIIVNRIENE